MSFEIMVLLQIHYQYLFINLQN